MKRWIDCGGDLGIGDVVRWTEKVWYKPRRGRSSKAMGVAEQVVTAQVQKWHGDWIYLEVMRCLSGESWYALGIEPLKGGDIIKRKRSTIARGDAQKLVEPERPPKGKGGGATVASRFMRPPHSG